MSTSTLPRIFIRHAATKAKAKAATGKKSSSSAKKRTTISDSPVDATRSDQIRAQIYGESFTDPEAATARRLEALQAVVPSLEAHETIERAWKLHQRREREEQSENLRIKYESMREALRELEKEDPRLFAAAVEGKISPARNTRGTQGDLASKEGRIPGLFPRQMRIPTETIGNFKWDESWQRPEEEESK